MAGNRYSSYAWERDKLFRGRRVAYCNWCRRPLMRSTATVDHVVPLTDGGSNDWQKNLVLACNSCNQRRNEITQQEAVLYKRALRLYKMTMGWEPARGDLAELVATVPRPATLAQCTEFLRGKE